MSFPPSQDPSLSSPNPATKPTLSDAERREEAKQVADSFPSITQVLEVDAPSPAAIQDRIDRIIAAADYSSPTSMAVTSLPPRSETSAIGTGATKSWQASSLTTSSEQYPTPTVPYPISIPGKPSPFPPTDPSVPSVPSTPSPTPTPTLATTAPCLRSLLASLSTCLRRRRSSIPSPNYRPLATLTLAERVALTTHRQRILAELGEEWLAPIVHEWPKWKRNPLTCSEESLVDLGFVAPTAEEVEAETRREGGKAEKGAQGVEGQGQGRAGQAENDTRPDLALEAAETIQILDELARFEFVFRDRAGEWEENVDPKTRTGMESGGDERLKRWLGSP